MQKIAILADSGCQLESSEGIYIVPLQLTAGDENYQDNVDISTKEIFELMKEKTVTTSQPSTGNLVDACGRIKKAGYDEIIAISIATGLSSTLNGMRVAAEMVNIPVTLVDSMGTAGNHRYLVELAKELVDQGKSSQEIKTILDECVENSDTLIMVPNLEHLKRGGRITPAVALLGNMLKIVPVMKLNHELNGKIDSFGKVRTIKKANQVIVQYMKEHGVNDKDFVITAEHVLCYDQEPMIRELLKSELDIDEVHIGLLPACVGVHMGDGGIGYQFIKKYKPED